MKLRFSLTRGHLKTVKHFIFALLVFLLSVRAIHNNFTTTETWIREAMGSRIDMKSTFARKSKKAGNNNNRKLNKTKQTKQPYKHIWQNDFEHKNFYHALKEILTNLDNF